MANYFLMMGILKDMDLDWGSMLTKMFSYMGVASGAGAADVQLVNCVARVDTFDQFRLYFVIPGVLLLAPWVALWGFAGLRRLAWVVRGREGGTLGSAKIWGHSKAFVYRQSVLVLSYFTYPVVVTNSFRVLHCTDIEGEERLVEDFSKPCSGSEYGLLWAAAVFVATGIALGVPFGIFFMMRRRQAELTEAGKAQTQFYFFFGEFRPEWYWWEMTVMARKVLMGAIAVLLNNHEQKMQVYVGTWLLLFSFTAQVTCLPHKAPPQRLLETAAQGAVLCSLLLGQGMAFQGVTQSQLKTFEWCVLALNVAVMNGMGLSLGYQIWNDAKEKIKVARRSTRLPVSLKDVDEVPHSSFASSTAESPQVTAFTGVNPMTGGGQAEVEMTPMAPAAGPRGPQAPQEGEGGRRRGRDRGRGRGRGRARNERRGRGRGRATGRGRGRARGPGPLSTATTALV